MATRVLTLLALLLCLTAQAGASKAENLLSARRTLFTENKGQVADQNGRPRSDVRYLYAAPGLRLALKANGFSYEVIRTESFASAAKDLAGLKDLRGLSGHASPDSVVEHSHRIDVSFAGANANPEIIADDAAPSYSNYYLAHTPEQGVTGVKSYAKLTYKNLYPNIDLVFYAKAEGQLKYDFVLHPGARLSDIKMQYAGQQGLEATGTALSIFTGSGKVQETIPASYYEGGQPVAVSYQLESNIIGFASQGIEKVSRTLVIDPTILWATYYGGTYTDEGQAIVLDAKGNVYLGGSSQSAANIATSGTHQTTIGSAAGVHDGFIARFDSTGKRAWGTYYGGNSADKIYGIALDGLGSLYVAGYTLSTKGIATSGVHQTSIASSNYDVMIARFDTAGKRSWGTYYGGTGVDLGRNIVADGKGKVYVIGATTSLLKMSTTGAHQTSGGSYNDAFLTEFTDAGKQVWGTYYGGKGDDDYGYGIALDTTGYLYIAGTATTGTNIATSGAHQTSFLGSGTSPDAFLAKFTTAGKRVWGTYYGGSAEDEGYSVVLDAKRNLYFAGSSASTSGVATSGTHQTSLGGSGKYDAFLTRFDTAGKRVWGTYFGGSDNDFATGLALDPSGNLRLAGTTNSASGIATSGAHKTSIYSTKSDAYLASFTSAGMRDWGTYYGGPYDHDYGHGLAVDGSGNSYITGHTYDNSGIATSGAHQTSNGSGSSTTYSDAFLAKFPASMNCTAKPAIGHDTAFCVGPKTITVRATGAMKYRWYSNATTGALLDTTDTYTFTVYKNDTFYVAGFDGQCESPRDTVSVTVNPLPAADAGKSISRCKGVTISLGASPVTGNTYKWTSRPAGFTSTLANPTDTPSVTTTYYLTETSAAGCSKSDSVKITVKALPTPSVTGPTSLCEGASATYKTPKAAGSVYSWIITGGSVIGANYYDTVAVKWTSSGTRRVKLIENNSLGCQDSSILIVKVSGGADARASDTSVCGASAITLTATGASRYRWYDVPTGGTSIDTNNIYSATFTKTDTLFVSSFGSTCGNKRDTVIVTVNPVPSASWTSTHITGRQYSFKANDATQSGYAWTFGDAATGSGATVSHTYTADNTYAVGLTVTSAAGCKATASDTLTVRLTALAPEEAKAQVALSVSPNPFSESATLSYALQKASRIRLQVFDAQGRTVASLADAAQPAGKYAYTLDAEKARLTPGLYLLKMWVDDVPLTRQVMYVR